MSVLSALLRCIPGAPIYIPCPVLEPEPEIPTAMDDWDEAFKAATGAYPPFSRLQLEPLVKARAERRYSQSFPMSVGPSITDCRIHDIAGQHGFQYGIMVDGGYEAAQSGIARAEAAERLYQEQRAYDIQWTSLAKRLRMHPSDSPAILTSILGQRPGSSRKVPPA